VIRELGPEASVGLYLPADEPVEPGQPDAEDGLGARDDAAVRVGEDVGYVRRFRDGGVAVVELLGDLQQLDLSAGLAGDEVVDVVEALDALHLDACALGDGDVDVLADRPEAAFDLSRRPEQHPDAFGRLAGLFRRSDVGFRPDLDEGDPEPVEAVRDAALALLDPGRRLLLQQHVRDPDGAVVGLDLAVGGDERRALEPGGVGAVDDDLPHHVGAVDDGTVHERRDLQSRPEGLLVESGRRLVVLLDETRRVEGEVLELPVDAGLLQGGLVDLAEFRFRRVEIPGERPDGRLRVAALRRTLTEELARRVELLVDLQPGDEPQILVVVRH